MYGDGQWQPSRDEGEWPEGGGQGQYGRGQNRGQGQQYNAGQQYGSPQAYGSGQQGSGRGGSASGQNRDPRYAADPRYAGSRSNSRAANNSGPVGYPPADPAAGQRTLDAGTDPFETPVRRRGNGPAPSGPRGRVVPASRKRKVLKWTALSMAGVLVAIIGVGAYVYIHLNGNINTAALLPPGASQAAEIPNQFGQTPLNILLIGSDTRDTATDCHLGGACQPSLPHADVEMVMHLSADRSNMTVMSIPRDSIVSLPSCARGDGAVNLVNSALNFGPGCQVEAIHELTGLTIDDFIEVDMGGVVSLTNALGPVPVCVKENIYDPDSHLKLPAGTSYIQGIQALEWLRTRHAFLNEVVREEAQHLFMSAMVRKLKANASLSHITTLYSVADTATKSLTVSPALGSVTSLLSLAQELGKVPTDRITMLSVPTEDYNGPISGYSQQLQFEQPAANNMFAAIKADTSYTAATAASASSSGAAGPKTTAPAAGTYPGNPDAVNKAGVSVSVLNASKVNGHAGEVKSTLAGDGFSSSLISTNTNSPTAATAVYYPSGRADSASAVASALGIPASAMHLSSSYSVVTVVVGEDWTSGGTFGAAGSGGSGGTAANPASVASSPPSSSLLTNGADDKACLEVQPNYRW